MGGNNNSQVWRSNVTDPRGDYLTSSLETRVTQSLKSSAALKNLKGDLRDDRYEATMTEHPLWKHGCELLLPSYNIYRTDNNGINSIKYIGGGVLILCV